MYYVILKQKTYNRLTKERERNQSIPLQKTINSQEKKKGNTKQG